jgi:hypothetical protein
MNCEVLVKRFQESVKTVFYLIVTVGEDFFLLYAFEYYFNAPRVAEILIRLALLSLENMQRIVLFLLI